MMDGNEEDPGEAESDGFFFQNLTAEEAGTMIAPGRTQIRKL